MYTYTHTHTFKTLIDYYDDVYNYASAHLRALVTGVDSKLNSATGTPLTASMGA